ncbi:DUF2851 family protein [Aestuariibaculum suncheonense]|uniref:DUF2851 family protein n=1 Tax=Aestuariibaculum suncheonense TaxID=1028745 RepID=A0A8J6QBB0_9FLAO|nr:DUF2851 family protein [Aestuariibaculum suncheonense]MBD0834528.1 DUF2851 family protein [Aestuariibaculum suncheonense]
MREDFLHYLWKHKKFQLSALKTTNAEDVLVSSVGQHNQNSGPDFFNAQLKIGEQLWAGNVEIHVKSSDWYLHNHEQDPAYDNVVLHVVWEHDTDVFRRDNTPIPTLELKEFTSSITLENYNNLFSKQGKWINCEADFASVSDFDLNHWLERLYFERLERKSKVIQDLLEATKNDWEAVLFCMLAKNFGLKVNGEAFFSMAQSVDYSVVRKSQSNQHSLEALFFGQAGLLEHDIQQRYYQDLVKEYQFLKQKFQVTNHSVVPVQYFRLRPPNFPTIRLSQLASLYVQHKTLFSKIIEGNNLEDYYNVFKVSTSEFWKTHYTFEKVSKSSVKMLTKSFVDLLLINTILPIKFCYARQQGKDADEEVLQIASAMASEKNSIVDAFNTLKPISKSAFQSQALLQLKNDYCDKNKCLQCSIGNKLIVKNV